MARKRSTRIGLIARCDEGGLGNLTVDFSRFIEPEVALVVMMGTLARGNEDTERVVASESARTVWYEHMVAEREPYDWLCAHCDVVYTAETPYNPVLYEAARARHTKVVVHAMPELLDDATVECADEVWLPTSWRFDEIAAAYPNVRLMPVPVALDEFDFDRMPDYGTPRLLHVGAPAMCDRAGTDMLTAAIKYVSEPCTIVAVHAERLRRTDAVAVEYRSVGSDRWSMYDGVSALLAPRRYGGLSLVAQEAAARGLGALVLAREPDMSWPGTVTIPTRNARQLVRMKGGSIEVEQPTAHAVAAGIDRLAKHTALRTRLGAEARQHAMRTSWATLRQRYLDAFASLAGV